MDLTTWLEQEKGRAASLAAHLDRTPAAVSQWKTNGVPLALMKAVRDFTGNAVTLEEMVPGNSDGADTAIDLAPTPAPDDNLRATPEPNDWPPLEERRIEPRATNKQEA